MQFTFGSDPEFPLVDAKGTFKSAIGIVKGDKENKIDLKNGHYAFYDNVLAEVNIRPESNKKDVQKSFRECFASLAKLIGKYKLQTQASMMYPDAECNHLKAKVFGCDPEYDAYTLESVVPPICTTTFRSAGGHIHLGMQNFETLSPDHLLIDAFSKIEAIKMMDLFVSIPALFIDHDSTRKARRSLYGKAGYHRPTPYGVEYRTTSNFWLASPKLVDLMFDISDFVLENLSAKKEEQIFDKFNAQQICSAINGENQTEGEEIFARVMKLFPSGIATQVEKFVKPYRFNIYEEWQI